MKRFAALLFILSIALNVSAQRKPQPNPATKKPLTHSVYDSWKEIPFKTLTSDGQFAVYTINPQDGDGKLIIQNLKTLKADSVARAANVAVTADAQYVVFKIKPQEKLVKDLKRQKKKKDELPKDSLGIYSLASGKVEKIPDVKSFKIPEKAGSWVIYQLEPQKLENGKKAKKNNDENGYTLVARNLTSGESQQFGYVKDYTVAEKGTGALFSTTGNDSTLTAGIFWIDFSEKKSRNIYNGNPKLNCKGLSISENGDHAAFLVDTDTTKALVRHFSLYQWNTASANSATEIFTDKSLKKEWLISEHRAPTFSKDGSKLYFGVAPELLQQDTSLLAEEIVNVEIWGGEDEYIYPQQNSRLQTDKKKSFLSSIILSDNSFTQLGSEQIPEISLGNEGNAPYVLGESDVPYRKMMTWDISAFTDFYLIDVKDGSRKSIATKVKGNARFSPKAKYAFWYSLTDTAWFAYSVAENKTVNLTDGINQMFADEQDDHPDYPGPYGFAGWTADDNAFVAYDRYDIWLIDPDMKAAPVNLTQNGRKERTVYRYIKLDPEERSINTDEELLLSAFNEVTRASGLYKLNVKDRKLTKLIFGEYQFGTPIKAKNAETLLYTRENFQEFPDLWTADMNFSKPRKLSEANPQMKNYLWGTVELVKWNSLDNIPLEGLLYKPEGFDPSKKYPMIVNFYEKSSEGLYQHHEPEPHRSTINKTFYASNGYVVFVPDVVYKIGFPGESAYNCVMPGVSSIVSKGFIDEKNIGVQGHSWGGYQIAHLVTRTNLFKAAEAGAPVANMISAYGGIRWESGLSRMFQYEHSQSRIGGTLWEKPLYFIENSPIFFADKIETPLLLLHNDSDGAVPWYQGIEFYMALRRLNKPVWMLNYNGEPHWPLKRQNRIDFQTRMKQFFDHYLKGAPMPEWMDEGIPAIEKGINKGY